MLLLLSLVGWVHASGVVINEAVIGPEGSDLNWVELYNSGDVAIDLGGWSIEWGTSDATYSGVHTFDSVEIAAGGYLLVGDTGVTGADVSAALTFGSGAIDSDAIRLVGSGSDFTDTLIYGSPNTDAWVGEDGVVAESLAPIPIVGGSLGRVVDGMDTDASGDDFVVFAVPTPGEQRLFSDGFR